MIYQQRLATHLYIVIVVVASSLVPAPAAIAGGPCTCREQRYCAPLSTPPAEKEIFPFVIPGSSADSSNVTAVWSEFRWDLITTASWAIGENETICAAHKAGARVVKAAAFALYGAAGSGKETYLGLMFNKTARAAYISQTVAEINRIGADGLNFDIEGNEAVQNNTAHELIAFLTELRAEAEKTNPHFQLSFETPIYLGQPSLIHANDWAKMIKPRGPVDFYIPMGYDMNGMGAIVRSIGKCSGSTPNSSTFEQCYCTEWASNNSCAVGGECTDGSVCVNAHVQGYGGDGHLAEANSPLPGLLMGLEQFKQAGVPADRVVIGLPWYGYDYACNDNITGAPCNATIGSKQGAPQLSYELAMQLLRNSTTGLMYNHSTASAWFDYTCIPRTVTKPAKPCTAGRHQVHIDTPGTIAIKLGALRAAGVRGVAWWNTGSVGYNTADHQAEEMWDALEAFVAPHSKPTTETAVDADSKRDEIL